MPRDSFTVSKFITVQTEVKARDNPKPVQNPFIIPQRTPTVVAITRLLPSNQPQEVQRMFLAREGGISMLLYIFVLDIMDFKAPLPPNAA